MKNATNITAAEGQGHSALSRKHGSTIALVLILGIALSTVVGALLSRGLSEKRINESHLLRQEAKNAAESVVEYGFAQLVQRFTRQTSFPLDDLKSGNNPIGIPPTFSSFMSRGYGDSHVNPSMADLQGGVIPPGTWMYINPKDPANEFDPLRGKLAFVRGIEVYGKAAAVSPSNGREVWAYTTQKLHVRDSPLFAHAMFYNMDLELHPGPTMNIYGPVHSNTDMYLQAVSKITFHEGVTSAERILHGYKKTNGGITQNGDVYIKDEDENSMNMYIGGSRGSQSSWLDHDNDDWRELSSQRWDGYVQDMAHGVPTLNPVGIADYVPDDRTTTANEKINYAYALIEPLLPASNPDRKSNAIREQKFAAKAGLLLRVERDTSFDTNWKDPGNELDRDDFEDDGDYWEAWEQKDLELNGHMYYADENEWVDKYADRFVVNAYKYQRTNPDDPKSDIVTDANGDPVLIPVDLPPGVIGGANENLTAVANDRRPEHLKWEDGTFKQGMYDHRQDMYIRPLSVDIGRLREVVDDNANPSGTDLAATHWNNTYDPQKDWNGVVYVETPTTWNTWSPSPGSTPTGWDSNGVFRYEDSGGRPDKIVPAYTWNELAVQTINAEKIPDPTFAVDSGLTLATNAPMYVAGNFNADGNKHADDANKPDNNKEPPAALIADSLTVLSEAWWKNKKYSTQGNTRNRKSDYTEISAAILTGLNPTAPDGSVNVYPGGENSGGAHNFPRFLEKWNDELTIRGSLVALFESEVAPKPMPNNHGHYYGPPSRDWGFNENFRNGNYPPGTPNARTFRRTDFRDLSKTEYEAELAAMWAQAN